ncbi:50S ribosomal protein L24 [Sedimentisphaera salicampi]|uniref:Large ribosomal subunit protein uL24 n=1 Tax=Sedimentisphaera salicampi TaxID=1941349 RepID=A0A1W6LPE8_9BACT|nr:50S ribosomal protein L24 [Sedimentisphaera salicampi]ARN57660.1 50S ribosomal protein L24 [Sedimentisphaera salicampi]OXU14225.1 50S ribosomal protein L24 [Sedimentisphaera salicampi]
MAARIKKGDRVVVISGTNKDRKGEVLRVMNSEKVIIEGVNLAKKHVRPSQKHPQGGQITVEQPIHISNVMPVNPTTEKGARVRFVEQEGGKKRVALDGTELGVVRKPKA